MNESMQPKNLTAEPHAQATRVTTPASTQPAAAPGARALHLRIERLSLPGYTPSQSRRFVAALSSAIAELSATHALPTNLADARLPRLDAGRLTAHATPEQTARQLAERLMSAVAGHDAQRTRHE